MSHVEAYINQQSQRIGEFLSSCFFNPLQVEGDGLFTTLFSMEFHTVWTTFSALKLCVFIQNSSVLQPQPFGAQLRKERR